MSKKLIFKNSILLFVIFILTFALASCANKGEDNGPSGSGSDGSSNVYSDGDVVINMEDEDADKNNTNSPAATGGTSKSPNAGTEGGSTSNGGAGSASGSNTNASNGTNNESSPSNINSSAGVSSEKTPSYTSSQSDNDGWTNDYIIK